MYLTIFLLLLFALLIFYILMLIRLRSAKGANQPASQGDKTTEFQNLSIYPSTPADSSSYNFDSYPSSAPGCTVGADMNASDASSGGADYTGNWSSGATDFSSGTDSSSGSDFGGFSGSGGDAGGGGSGGSWE